MEFSRRIGGIGRFDLTERESRFLRGFFDLKNENTHRTKEVHLTAPAQQTLFQEMMETLFPALEAKPSPNGIHVVTVSDQNSYKIEGTERIIPLQPRLSYHPESLDLQLHLITPPLVEHFDFSACYVTCTLPDSYVPTCVDDVAQIVGAYQTTIPMEKITSIEFHNETKKFAYGIADIRDLPNVLRVYQRAVEMVESAPKIIGIKFSELNIVRRDAAHHENAAMRNLSKDFYRASLEKLTTL